MSQHAKRIVVMLSILVVVAAVAGCADMEGVDDSAELALGD
jgi:hypothetical protein